MNNLLLGFGGGLLVAVTAGVVWRLARRKHDRGGTAKVTHETFVTSMRAVGELSAFRIMTKEVISASEHWFGEFGRKYLNWLLSERRINGVVLREFEYQRRRFFRLVN